MSIDQLVEKLRQMEARGYNSLIVTDQTGEPVCYLPNNTEEARQTLARLAYAERPEQKAKGMVEGMRSNRFVDSREG